MTSAAGSTPSSTKHRPAPASTSATPTAGCATSTWCCGCTASDACELLPAASATEVILAEQWGLLFNALGNFDATINAASGHDLSDSQSPTHPCVEPTHPAGVRRLLGSGHSGGS